MESQFAKKLIHVGAIERTDRIWRELESGNGIAARVISIVSFCLLLFAPALLPSGYASGALYPLTIVMIFALHMVNNSRINAIIRMLKEQESVLRVSREENA